MRHFFPGEIGGRLSCMSHMQGCVRLWRAKQLCTVDSALIQTAGGLSTARLRRVLSPARVQFCMGMVHMSTRSNRHWVSINGGLCIDVKR